MSYHQLQKSYAEKGFSMVELAVVMVILGLLIGGAVAGREVLKVSKLRSVIADLQKYKVAVTSFEQTYGELPGDLSNAADVWGVATTSGDGNGWVGNGNATDYTEPFTAWDQLALAKMITGTYSGAGTSSNVGVNTPESSGFEGAGFSLSYHAAPWGHTDSLGRAFPANYFMFGRNHTTRNDVLAAVLSPEDAFYIDSKMDDGTPDYGDVIAGNSGAMQGNSGNCTQTAPPNAEYNTTNNQVACTPMFKASSEL